MMSPVPPSCGSCSRFSNKSSKFLVLVSLTGSVCKRIGVLVWIDECERPFFDGVWCRCEWTSSSCVYAIFTYLTIIFVVLLFCRLEVLVDGFGCPVLPVWLFVCLWVWCPCLCAWVWFNFQSANTGCITSHFRTFAFTFSLSSPLLIHVSFSLFLSLSRFLPFFFSLSSLFSSPPSLFLSFFRFYIYIYIMGKRKACV